MIGRNAILPTVPDAVPLQWANGKTLARLAGTTDRFTSFVGFHIEVKRDTDLDAALEAAGVLQIEIKHQRQGGAEIVRHWDLSPQIHFLPITAGPVADTVAASLSNGNGRRTADAGIGARWGQEEYSRYAVRGFVASVWKAGYRRPVQLGVRSRMTDRLHAAMLDHTRVAAAADNLVDRTRHPEIVSPAELWLPLGPDEEAEFGKGDTATVTPLKSLHPEVIDAEYLRTIWRPEAVFNAACDAWKVTQRWAAEYQAGRTGEDAPPTPQPDAPAQAEPAEPGGLFTDDEAPTAPQPSARIAAETGAAPRARRGRH